MSAVADSDAISICLLPYAECGHGSASCAVAVGSRSFGTGPVPYSADCDHHYDVLDAADDAAGWNGSVATEDDEPHDAGHAGAHELEFAGRIGIVLGRGSNDRDRATVSDESHVARPRNARDDGETGKEGRQIGVSLALTPSSVANEGHLNDISDFIDWYFLRINNREPETALCLLLTRSLLQNKLENFYRLSFPMAASN